MQKVKLQAKHYEQHLEQMYASLGITVTFSHTAQYHMSHAIHNS